MGGTKPQRWVPNAYTRTVQYRARTHAAVMAAGRPARSHESLNHARHTAETYHTTRPADQLDRSSRVLITSATHGSEA